MPKEMTVSISDQSEVQEMFNYLCKKILLRDPTEVKKASSIPTISNYQLSFGDLVKAAEKYNVRFEFIITYTKSDFTESEAQKPIVVNEDSLFYKKEYYKDDVTRKIESQAKEITNIELIDVVKVDSIKEVKEMDDSDFFRNANIPMPDFI